jgi:hypothetical protein
VIVGGDDDDGLAIVDDVDVVGFVIDAAEGTFTSSTL